MINKIIVNVQEGLESFNWLKNVELFSSEILDFLGIEHWELSIFFCNDDFICDLNKKFRNIDAPTDVLSFEQGDEYIDDDDITWMSAGDIVISIDSLHSNAKEFNENVNLELKRLILHGILHLNGMDHSDNSPEQEMLQFQEHVLTKFKDTIVYGDS